MRLITDNYSFHVIREKPTKNQYFYTIGNVNKAPCLVILVCKHDDKWLMCIEDLHYEPTCSFDKKLPKKTGTIEMVQGAIKAVMQKHPKVSVVELQDKSKFLNKNGVWLPLPEYRVIMKGKTWYQEHFGAEPTRDGLKLKLLRYFRKRKELKEYMSRKGEVSLSVFTNLLKEARLPQLSGEAWIIPKGAIEHYNVNARFEDSKQNLDGGGFADVEDEPFELYFQEIPFL
jgi:hypothetical protein